MYHGVLWGWFFFRQSTPEIETVSEYLGHVGSETIEGKKFLCAILEKLKIEKNNLRLIVTQRANKGVWGGGIIFGHFLW